MTTLLVDGNHLSYRCKFTYYLWTDAGEDVSVVYGFLSVLISEINKLKPDHIIVVWDGGIQDFRKKLLPNYKKGRHARETEEERENFRNQLQLLQNTLPMLGIPSVRIEGYEADDVIYTLSRLTADKCVIYSGDSDMLQAVTSDESVVVYNPAKKQEINYYNFDRLVGIHPDRYVDYRIITGDDSDNIKGIKGIGPKGASELLNEYGTVEQAKQASKNGNWKLRPAIKTCLMNVKEDYIYKVRKVIKLVYDHSLVSQIYDAMANCYEYDHIKIKRFLISKQFISLMSRIRAFEKLSAPVLKNLNYSPHKLIIVRE